MHFSRVMRAKNRRTWSTLDHRYTGVRITVKNLSSEHRSQRSPAKTSELEKQKKHSEQNKCPSRTEKTLAITFSYFFHCHYCIPFASAQANPHNHKILFPKLSYCRLETVWRLGFCCNTASKSTLAPVW